VVAAVNRSGSCSTTSETESWALDFILQAVGDMLDRLDQDDKNADDGFRHGPSEIFNYLRAIL